MVPTSDSVRTSGAGLSDDRLRALHRAGQEGFLQAVATASPDGAWLREGGLAFSRVPAASGAAILNGVFFDDPAELLERFDALAAGYAAAGVERWGVWVPPTDRETPRRLRDRGHKRRIVPAVMGAPLAEVRTAPWAIAGLDADLDADPCEVARCQDVAFGVQQGQSLVPALAPAGAAGIRGHVVRRGGETVCGLLTQRDGERLYTWGFAATGEARGPLVAPRLMRAVLHAAVAEGASAVVCEVTPDGEAMARFLRLRSLGRLALWEREPA